MSKELNCMNCSIGDFKHDLCDCDNGFCKEFKSIGKQEDFFNAVMQRIRPQGEWIVYEGGWKDLDYYPPKCKCNQCGYEEELYILNAKPTNFCPHCGADMREREDE